MKAQREKMRLPALELRVELHTGPVMSGVVGRRKFTFDIWGDAVNTAALMEFERRSGTDQYLGNRGGARQDFVRTGAARRRRDQA